MRGLIDKKRGAAHFEMIVSFVFFVGFVFFLFMVLKPQDTGSLSGAVVAGLYDSFEEEVHTNLSSAFLGVDYTSIDEPSSSCFYVELPGHVFSYAIIDKGSYVTMLGDEGIASNLVRNVNRPDNSDLNIDREFDGISFNEFFRVAISPEFGKDPIGGCIELPGFELGSIVERRVVSYSKLRKMEDRYRDEYEDLKKELRVPAIFDFAISPESLDINMEPRFGIPNSVEVVAQDRIVEVLYKDGTVVNERFTLKIW